MATQSVQKKPYGPTWPLGMITVATPSTPVRITSLVDPNNYNAPETATSANSQEYSPNVQQVIIFAVKPGASHGTQSNAGNIYVLEHGVGGAGDRDDYGVMVAALGPGQSFVLGSAPANRNSFSPYSYWIDADNAGDSALVVAVPQ